MDRLLPGYEPNLPVLETRMRGGNWPAAKKASGRGLVELRGGTGAGLAIASCETLKESDNLNAEVL